MDDLWSSLWDVAWLFFLGFASVAYLFAIFTVLTDLFRDRHLNGWGKAAWILCLVFVPFLTVLVYVIVRGRGMVDRLERNEQGVYGPSHAHVAGGAASVATGPAPGAPSVSSPVDEITRAKQLLDAGVIEQHEFDRLKNRALAERR